MFSAVAVILVATVSYISGWPWTQLIVISNKSIPAVRLGHGDTHDDSQVTKVSPKWALSGATGPTFSGEAVRQFPSDQRRFHAFDPKNPRLNSTLVSHDPWCEKWAVVTTIFDVLDAVR